MPENFSHPSLDFSLYVNRKLDSPRYDENFFGFYYKSAVESAHEQGPLVGYNQEVTIRIVQRSLAHRCIGTICVDGNALLQGRLSSTQKRHQTLNEVD